MRTITLEEHFVSPGFLAGPGKEFTERLRNSGPHGAKICDLLQEVGDKRVAEMDAAGIDVQVLSHGAPSVQRLDAETSVWMARGANDRLAGAIKLHPHRFAGFAALPTPDPEAAAAELDRAVTSLGFKGAMVHGLTNGVFLDDRRFWPIFERAQALDVPIYVHPSFPNPVVIDAYYKTYAADYPELIGPALGFTVETATQAVRLVLSGVFEKYPRLKIILGHLGEGIPFLLWRIDQSLSRSNSSTPFKEVFRRNFYLTTSGNFSDTALTASISEMGIDRIMFSVDWPFISNKMATDWLKASALSAADKAKVFSGNAKALLKL